VNIQIDATNPAEVYAALALPVVAEGVLKGGPIELEWQCSQRITATARVSITEPELAKILTALAAATPLPVHAPKLPVDDPPFRLAGITPWAEPLQIDWWLDLFGTTTGANKSWGGQMTAAGIWTSSAAAIQPADGLHQVAYLGGATGLDYRFTAAVLDLGFSSALHGLKLTQRPAIELLAMIGMQLFAERDKREHAYTIVPDRIGYGFASIADLALGGSPVTSTFRWCWTRNGQSRKIACQAEPIA
jgi:hypothetical protein